MGPLLSASEEELEPIKLPTAQGRTSLCLACWPRQPWRDRQDEAEGGLRAGSWATFPVPTACGGGRSHTLQKSTRKAWKLVQCIARGPMTELPFKLTSAGFLRAGPYVIDPCTGQRGAGGRVGGSLSGVGPPLLREALSCLPQGSCRVRRALTAYLLLLSWPIAGNWEPLLPFWASVSPE